LDAGSTYTVFLPEDAGVRYANTVQEPFRSSEFDRPPPWLDDAFNNPLQRAESP
jgi:hypothetical protein